MNDRISNLAFARPHPEGAAAGWDANARHLAGDELAQALQEARARTWLLVDDLSDDAWRPPLQAGVNPIAWELAHLAWFAEFWILRGPHLAGANGLTHASRPACIAGPDAHLDSNRLPHAKRWTTGMPARSTLKQMLGNQLDACLMALPRHQFSNAVEADSALYFHRLALFHEDMHAEALCWLRSALGYAAPPRQSLPQCGPRRPIHMGARDVYLGSASNARGFAFDNERPGNAVQMGDFEIDSEPVSAMEFAEFLDAGGYERAQYWPARAGHWRAQTGLRQPAHWRRAAGGPWQIRWFDQWIALQPGIPALHLNAFEAEAYCLWAKRCLPTAAQWEYAASAQEAGGLAFSWGHSVWEWTADTFEPYPGFASGPYREYSEPWFGDHRELRGGSFAAHKRMHHPHYRNFFLPQRSDVFAGFRTAAIQG